MAERGFAVVHVNTTGVFPGAENRIVEIAIVQLSPQGRVQQRWSHALIADSFRDLAPHIAQLVAGRALVAHNASFVVPVVMAQLTHANLIANTEPVTWCTMQLALDLFPSAGRSLQQCVVAAGMRTPSLATAEAAADATARLFGVCIEVIGEPEFWNHGLDAATDLTWRTAPGVSGDTTTSAPSQPQELRGITGAVNSSTPFLVSAIERMPRYRGPREHLDYLDLIDRTLRAGDCSTTASENLIRAAERLGIGRFLCESINRDYFAELVNCVDVAGGMTPSDIADLVSVGHVLDLPSSVISATLRPLSDDAEHNLHRRLAG